MYKQYSLKKMELYTNKSAWIIMIGNNRMAIGNIFLRTDGRTHGICKAENVEVRTYVNMKRNECMIRRM